MHDLTLRPALPPDAAAVALVLRTALRSLPWMPELHSAEEDLAFVRHELLARQSVIVAEEKGVIVGFSALDGNWLTQLHVLPSHSCRGIGDSLLTEATESLGHVRLYCFAANTAARSFYEARGFVAEAFSDGTRNEERLPDVLYVRRSGCSVAGCAEGH